MLLSIQDGIRNLSQLIFKVFLQDDTLQKVLLSSSHFRVEDFPHVKERKSKEIASMEL